MKKILSITILFLSLTAPVLACKPHIDPRVEKDFNSKFLDVQDICWTTGDNYYRAEFSCSGSWQYAWYSAKGDYLGLTRNIHSAQLPLLLRESLIKDYSRYWITSLVEENKNNLQNSYYITLEDADKKLVLKSKNGKKWKVCQSYSKS